MIVRGQILKAEADDKPPALRPLHKHAVETVNTIKDLTKRHTTRQELLARMRKTGWFPAMSGDT